MNEDDKVVLPGSEVETPQETVENETPQAEETSTPSETAPEEEEVVLGKPKSHWEKLEQENERLRSGQSTISKRLARYEKLRNISGNEEPSIPQDPADLDSWAKNPLSQELLLKAAETEMKEGLEEVLADYPNISPELVKAIRANPRGFVKPGTVYVDDALIDIEEYISGVSQGEVTTTPSKPKDFAVIGNNGGTTASGDPKVNKLLELFKTKAGVNRAFAMLTDREVDQKTFDKATELAEKAGLL